MDYRIDCRLDYEVLAPSVFVFNIEAAELPGQRIAGERLTITPAQPHDRWTDALANRFVRVCAEPGPLSIAYEATVARELTAIDTSAPELPVGSLPPEALRYLLPSRYCESDAVFPLAARLFGNLPPGYARVAAICEWIRRDIAYQVGTSLPHGTARDVLLLRTGVCRDFAHVAIALCRALNIPARFATAHALWPEPPPDFHAMFEAWLGDRWVLFDPTAMARLDRTVRIGTGRDAADVPFATIFGQARMVSMSPNIEMIDEQVRTDAAAAPAGAA